MTALPTSHPKIKGLACIALLAASLFLSAVPGHAAITLVNGGFEDTGALYNPVFGGLFEPTGWTNLSALPDQASSAPLGAEGVFMSGNRFLRLASDFPAPLNQGATTQLLGTMTAGETYIFTASVAGGLSTNSDYNPTASFVNEGIFDPSVTYASQSVSIPIGTTTGINFSYKATAADDGMPLYILLKAGPSAAGTAQRGGIDNATVQTIPVVSVPETGTLALMLPLVGIGGAALKRRKKRP